MEIHAALCGLGSICFFFIYMYNSNDIYLVLYTLQHLCDEEVKTVEITVPPKPVSKYPALFRWTGAGKEVSIAGSFNSWRGRIPLVKRSANKLLLTRCLMVFFTDKVFTIDNKCFALAFIYLLSQMAGLVCV